ncbi:MAG: hypothetical protein M1391_03030 [Bacteroidetes bacterium]|nr:hypothetical protein [Bacteroidota bacterium]
MDIIIFVALLILLAIGLFIYQITRLAYKERKKYFDIIFYISFFILILVIGIVLGHYTKFYIGGVIIFVFSIILFKTYYKNRW